MNDPRTRLATALAGRYRIERELGAGGMATVYLAHDEKHDRNVAIKVLKPELAAVLGAERFVVEIRTTASLQHPHILPLFDSGTADGFLYYVMPFIEGETIRDRLNRETQFGVEESVRITREVADALDYAHRHGVIHRDIKPENILLHDGRAMVMDFGIALAVSAAAGGRMTETGLSLGTPHYMSPEQATADKEISPRSDVYSLASVLYEMLAGEPPHTGGSAQAVIMKIVTDVARPVTELRRNVPLNVAAALAKALEKLPADRFASAHAFRDALANPTFASATTTGVLAGGLNARRSLQRGALLGGIAASLVIAPLMWIFAPHDQRSDTARPAVRFQLALKRDERITDGIGSPFAVSPDGQFIVYSAIRNSAASKLFVRRVDDLEARELQGTEGAFQATVSPDNQWIAYVANNQVRKISIAGGTSTVLATMPAVRGLTWVPNGDIVAGTVDRGLFVVPATGGRPREIPCASGCDGAGGVSYRWPVAFPDGRAIAFTVYRGGGVVMSRLGVLSLDDERYRETDVAGAFPLGMVDDHLLYVDGGGTLTATRYDAGSHTLTNAPVSLGEQTAVDPTATNALAAYSPAGTLIFQRGTYASQLTRVALDGSMTPIAREERVYQHPRLSPDGTKIAVAIVGSGPSDIWILDRSGGTPSRLTTSTAAANDRPEWTPDGKRVLFRSTRDGVARAYSQVVDGSATAELISSGVTVNEAVASPDGKTLLLRVTTTGGKYFQDLAYRPSTGDSTLTDFVVSSAYETAQRFSPDGKWVAYASDETVQRQVYVTPFPGPGPRYQISNDGGEQPLWSPDGRTLYYVRGRHLVAASLRLTTEAAVTERQVLFDGDFVSQYTHTGYDVEPDGKHFIMLRAIGGSAPTLVVYDWLTELRGRLRGQ